MKILRLELFGFKSFKDKTIVAFDQPVTAIVGSNGCGKSNVVDALYWVMGDMSPKHLRGSSMLDVIFSGSKDTAPLDMAEVTLVLERNPEVDPALPPQFQAQNEIQITRRYYRSGESEYFINKVNCRLRDIQEFFMDTGIGAKAYSIIEQGAITRMVSLKADERRTIIEEVAGIMKFKARKAETQRKLENSRLNLQRLDDIVGDLQKQLSSLKRQATKAEKFKEYSEELRMLELRLGTREWKSRNENRDLAIGEASELRNKVAELRQIFEAEKINVDKAEEALASLDSELEERRMLTRKHELALKDLEAEETNLKTRHESFGSRIASNAETVQEITTREEILLKELGRVRSELQTEETRSAELAASLEAEETRNGNIRSNLDSVREELQSERKELHTQEIIQTKITQEIQNLQRQIAQNEDHRSSLRSQIDNLSSELELHGAERSTTLQSLEQAFATRSELESAKIAVDEELARLDEQRTVRSLAREEAKESLSRVQIRKEQLEALENELDGVESAAKTLAIFERERGNNECILANRVQVPELLESATEALLGRNLERIVARNVESVSQFSEILAGSEDEKLRQARAPLWIPELASAPAHINLDSITVATVPNPVAQSPLFGFGSDGQQSLQPAETDNHVSAQTYLNQHQGVLGPLVDLIVNERANKEVLPDWLGLLENVWVVRSREDLMIMSKVLAKIPLTFVSLAGDVLSPNGFLDLAPAEASSAETGLISRKRLIAELASKESTLSQDLEEQQRMLDECMAAISAEKEKFRALTSQLAALNPDVERHSTFLREVEAQLARLSEKRSLLEANFAESEVKSQEANAKLSEESNQLEAAEEEKSRGLAKVGNLELRVASVLEEQQAQNAELAQVRTRIREHDNRLAELQTQRATLEQEQSLTSTRLTQINEESGRLQNEMQQIEIKLDEIEVSTAARRSELNQSRDNENEMLESVGTQKKALKELQVKVESLGSEVSTIAERIHELDQSVAINDVELKNISDKLEEKYQIELAKLPKNELEELSTPSDIEELADPSKGRERSSQLRKKIERLGRINMVAIEEFEEIQTRHEYLYIQRQDLNLALSQLKDAIDRIDRESKERFAEAFAAVNGAFQKTFPILFGGGNAELRLTDPENLLETGVEIAAQPPGKKLQSVSLLSGGEKALTAVSLIFGIFSIKPSPFCVLDEVDAPLDDANVGRFNRMVRTITDKSQVIIITHHKKTMEESDALFGVTMERPGISKLASVELGEFKG